MFGWHDNAILPTPLAELHPEFVSNFGRPLGLWLPCDGPEHKAYDLAGNDAKNPGSLNGGITTVPGGFGTLGAAWKFNSGYVTNGVTYSRTLPVWYSVDIFVPTTSQAAIFLDDAGGVTASGENNGLAIGIGSGTGDVAGNNLLIPFWGVSWQDTRVALGTGWKTIDVFISSARQATAFVDGNPVFSGTAVMMATGPAYGGLVLGADAQTSNRRYFSGSIGRAHVCYAAPSNSQISSLYNCLLTGEPFPLFAPTPLERAYGYAASGGGAAKPPPPELLYGRAA